MKISREDFARTQATQWFRTLERQLGELHQVEIRTRLAMPQLEAEARQAAPRSALTWHVKYRKGNPLPDAIHRGRICGSRPKRDRQAGTSGKPFKRWFEHHPGKLTRKDTYYQAQEVGLQALFMSFDLRKRLLNRARELLVIGRMSIAARVRALVDPRPWEAGELSLAAPLLIPQDLPASSQKALGGAWRIFLRAASVRYELAALALRHNADPPLRGLWLAFRVDQEHQFGRFVWTRRGIRLSLLARRRAKGKHPGRVDEASLPDRLLRELHIPAAARKAIRPHELHRRRMSRIYRSYVAVLEPLLSSGPKALQKAERLLRRAGVPEAELSLSFSDPVPRAI